MSRTRRLPWLLPVPVLLAACSLQPPAHTGLPVSPAAWTTPQDSTDRAPLAGWAALQDPAIETLMAQAEHDAPTLEVAAARIEQARAALGSAHAAEVPHLAASVAGSRGTNSASFPVMVQNSASAALNASWEIDLFGRLRHAAAGAQARLDAADADARLARLTLDALVADTVLLRRACGQLAARQRETVQSAETTLQLTERKQGAGFAAPLDVARARTSVGEARSQLAATSGQCRQYSEVLAALSGAEAPAVERLLAASAPPAADAVPDAPPMALAVPAQVLAAHPGLQSAERLADAASEDVGEARASRLPSLSLSALLASSWIQFGPIDQGVNSWSFGPSLAVAAFDGGSGAAGVDAARARYREALANLRQTLRDTVRDVELALIQGASAQEAAHEARATLDAAQALFRASEAAQRAGRLSLFDLEIARSALLSAQSSLIGAQRDRARAWVALVKASGGAPLAVPTP